MVKAVEDRELIRQYAEQQSEDAFAQLVARHIDLVYSTSLRLVGAMDAAEDVAQTVFIDLARKAVCLHPATVLSGWLYRGTVYAAANFRRAERRRRWRETQALAMKPVVDTQESLWQSMAPCLEQAMDRLHPVDQNAIILHYFEGKNMNEVGQILAISAGAAQKRVNRAVEKLRKYFVRMGVKVAAAVPQATAPPISTSHIYEEKETLEKTRRFSDLLGHCLRLLDRLRDYFTPGGTQVTSDLVASCLAQHAVRRAPPGWVDRMAGIVHPRQ